METTPFWDLLTESALQVLGVKKLKSGRAKRQACLTKCWPKRMLAAKKEEFACMREGFNFRPIDAQRRVFFGYFFDLKQKSDKGKEMKTILKFSKKNNCPRKKYRTHISRYTLN
ncbi:hypothetical protein [Echinicola strongylocentroti]|nr:hypothetical protein [Echinicola strongylocentroti]